MAAAAVHQPMSILSAVISLSKYYDLNRKNPAVKAYIPLGVWRGRLPEKVPGKGDFLREAAAKVILNENIIIKDDDNEAGAAARTI